MHDGKPAAAPKPIATPPPPPHQRRTQGEACKDRPARRPKRLEDRCLVGARALPGRSGPDQHDGAGQERDARRDRGRLRDGAQNLRHAIDHLADGYCGDVRPGARRIAQNLRLGGAVRVDGRDEAVRCAGKRRRVQHHHEADARGRKIDLPQGCDPCLDLPPEDVHGDAVAKLEAQFRCLFRRKAHLRRACVAFGPPGSRDDLSFGGRLVCIGQAAIAAQHPVITGDLARVPAVDPRHHAAQHRRGIDLVNTFGPGKTGAEFVDLVLLDVDEEETRARLRAGRDRWPRAGSRRSGQSAARTERPSPSARTTALAPSRARPRRQVPGAGPDALAAR